MRRQLSVPVSLMVIIAGAVLSYYILHSRGWSWNGTVSLSETFRHLTLLQRALVVAGLILNAWGLGGLVNGVTAKPRDE
jgi:hypothetical protein